MTLTLKLNDDLDQRLTREAKRRGLPADQFALNVLDQSLPRQDRKAQALSLLQSWVDDDDAGEQKETGDYLIQALDQDRLSDRSLFPEKLKGKSW